MDVSTEEQDENLSNKSARKPKIKFKSRKKPSKKKNEVLSGDGLFPCHLCSYRGTTKKYLAKHLKRHQEPTIKCKFCDRMFYYQSKMLHHMLVHTGEKPYKCDECGKAFNTGYSLNTHKYIHTNSKPYVCGVCDYACRDSSTLRKHMSRHSGDVQRYQCTECGRTWKSKRQLKFHVAAKHLGIDLKIFECSQCPKRFMDKSFLSAHIKSIHEGSYSTTCPVCGVRIAQRSNLSKHMLTHGEERPYKCATGGCGKSFKDPSSLRKHRATHNLGRQLPCPDCEQLFARPETLARHRITLHGPARQRRKPVPKQTHHECDLCGFVSRNKPGMVVHIKNFHTYARKCRVCNKTFTHKWRLKRHYTIVHGLDYESTLGHTSSANKSTAQQSAAQQSTAQQSAAQQSAAQQSTAQQSTVTHTQPVKEEPADDVSMDLFEIDKEEPLQDLLYEGSQCDNTSLAEESCKRIAESTVSVHINDIPQEVFTGICDDAVTATDQNETAESTAELANSNAEHNKYANKHIMESIINKRQEKMPRIIIKDIYKNININSGSRIINNDIVENSDMDSGFQTLDDEQNANNTEITDKMAPNIVVTDKMAASNEVTDKIAVNNEAVTGGIAVNNEEVTDEIAVNNEAVTGGIAVNKEAVIEGIAVNKGVTDETAVNNGAVTDKITVNKEAVTGKMPVNNEAITDRIAVNKGVTDETAVNNGAVTDKITVNKEAVTGKMPVNNEAVTDRIAVNKGVTGETAVNNGAVTDKVTVNKEAVTDKMPVNNEAVTDRIAVNKGVTDETAVNNGAVTDKITVNKEAVTDKMASNSEIVIDKMAANEEVVYKTKVYKKRGPNPGKISKEMAKSIIEKHIGKIGAVPEAIFDELFIRHSVKKTTENYNLQSRNNKNLTSYNNFTKTKKRKLNNRKTTTKNNGKNIDDDEIKSSNPDHNSSANKNNNSSNTNVKEHSSHKNVKRHARTRNDKAYQNKSFVIKCKLINESSNDTRPSRYNTRRLRYDYKEMLINNACNDEGDDRNDDDESSNDKQWIPNEETEKSGGDNLEKDESSRKEEKSRKREKISTSETKSRKREKRSTSKAKRKKALISGHQCYVCFKIYETEDKLIDHCKDHFDICNSVTIKKCPLCDFVSYQLPRHMQLIHNIDIRRKYNAQRLQDRKDNTKGSRYYVELKHDKFKEIEVIPSVKHLNKIAGMNVDKKKREDRDKQISKQKLVKKKQWVVENEKLNVDDVFVPKLDKKDTDSEEYMTNMRKLYFSAKKEGKVMMFPCRDCDKICQTFSALKLHRRRHDPNKKPFKAKVWKHKMRNIEKNKTGNEISDDKNTPDEENPERNDETNKKRYEKPKPIVNKHKCAPELKSFYENCIRGGDIEFWQFLKIYNKMGRENIKDFEDLEKRKDFAYGMHTPGNIQDSSTSNITSGNNQDGGAHKVTPSKTNNLATPKGANNVDKYCINLPKSAGKASSATNAEHTSVYSRNAAIDYFKATKVNDQTRIADKNIHKTTEIRSGVGVKKRVLSKREFLKREHLKESLRKKIAEDRI